MPDPDAPLAIPVKRSQGLASLVLTLVELLRQLMEAQVVRRMEANTLTPEEIERAGQSLWQLRQQVLEICQILDINPEDLNLEMGELGSLLPKRPYYPGGEGGSASILELLDRLITTGIVIDGELDLGLAQLNLIQARLKLILTSSSKLI
ncbi:MAG: gas vesicle protein K [Thermostichales cyanobacterium GMQP_bins_62]